MQRFLSELQRRKVLRVASGYVVAGWIILQVALSLQAAMKLPDWFSTVIVSLLIIGFPIAVIVSWFFEFTPEGIKRTVPSGDVARFKPQTTDFALAAALVLVLAAVTVQLTTPPAAVNTAAAPKSEPAVSAAFIAVLPFADLSPAKDQEYFSDGIAEEILNVLANVSGLEVASRTSSFQFKGQEKIGVPLIAKQLGVRHILEGSVRKAGDTIRITAQLIDAGDDRHLWSKTFDRPLTAENIFEIQDEIATAIVAALRQSLGLETLAGVTVAPTTDNVAAYELFLRARALFQARNDLDDADDMLSRALTLDPGFAKAWELRAAVQNVIDEYGYSDLPKEELDRRGAEFAQKALAIEPQSATAIAALANLRATAALRLRAQHSLKDIIGDFRRALAIEPRDGSALNWLGLTYAAVGESQTALETFRRCVEFEPLYAPCVENEYEMLAVLGRMDESLEAYERALDRGLTTEGYVNFALLAHFELKAAFMQAANHSLWLKGWRRHAEIYDAFRNLDDDHDALVKDIRRFLTDKGGGDPEYISNLLMPLGARDLMPTALSLVWGKDYAKYRRTPEFKTYVRESGIEDYWRAASFPPQCKPVGKDDFACE
jgi:TolB-like protein